MMTLATFLVVVWLLAVLGGMTLGGYIHALLGVAILMMAVRWTPHRRSID
jgi:dipeptide/tripeptide permease